MSDLKTLSEQLTKMIQLHVNPALGVDESKARLIVALDLLCALQQREATIAELRAENAARKQVIDCPDWMAVSATRYALGQMSYIVQETTKFLIHNLDRFTPETRELVLRYIREAVHQAEAAGGFVGMEMDHREWKKVLAHFQEPSHV